jgi:hypothetical protein
MRASFISLVFDTVIAFAQHRTSALQLLKPEMMPAAKLLVALRH